MVSLVRFAHLFGWQSAELLTEWQSIRDVRPLDRVAKLRNLIPSGAAGSSFTLTGVVVRGQGQPTAMKNIRNTTETV